MINQDYVFCNGEKFLLKQTYEQDGRKIAVLEYGSGLIEVPYDEIQLVNSELFNFSNDNITIQ